ncbi:MAG: rhodanese-like domain-containing protein [Methanothrix sp.]
MIEPSCRESDCSAGQMETIVKELSPQECRDLIGRKSGWEHDPPAAGRELVILDVRTAGEYSSGHIAGAINIDYRSPSFEDQLSMLDRDVAILLYCRTGVRSLKALQIMKRMGFSEIYNLTEGLVGWKRDGGEIV